MKKNWLVLAIVAVIIIASIWSMTLDWRGKEDSVFYKGIGTAIIPSKCSDSKDDVCALFACMVDLCWCDDSSPELPILHEGNAVITTEEEAKEAVQDYVGPEIKVMDAVRLNNIFYNVFADDGGEEVTYTVAVDGTIIKAICGV